jgi:hypothetical protein
MTHAQKVREMRNAIDAIDLALHSDVDWEKQRTLFEDARDDLKIRIEMTVQNLRQLCDAKDECNRIINSTEFTPANLEQ